MIKALRKKNSEYSINERRVSATVILVLSGVFSYFGLANSTLSESSAIYPYVGSLLIGFVFAFLAYKVPKFVHLTIFSLPLMFFGS